MELSILNLRIGCSTFASFRCPNTTVAWLKSYKTGKYVLVFRVRNSDVTLIQKDVFYTG